MKALILNIGSELKKLLMKKKYLVLTVLGAIICILRIGGNILVSKITGGEVVIKSNLIMEMVGFVFDILVPAYNIYGSDRLVCKRSTGGQHESVAFKTSDKI